MIELATRRVGATELRTIAPGTADYRRWIDIVSDAYPIVKVRTAAQRDAAFEEQRDLAVRQPEHRLIGAFRDGRLVGGMRVYDFTMCVRGSQVFTGGVGSVAVGLEYKQRGIARDCIFGFLDEYRERGAAMATLYPFRPDFYTALGFGFGAKLNQYRIALSALPPDGERERVRRLGPADTDEYLALYARTQERTNGLIRREPWRAAARLADAESFTFGYDDGKSLRGYLTYEVTLGKTGSSNKNDLYLHELMYETPVALNGLLAFARSQRDQFASLVLNTQDPDMHVLFTDPRNGSNRTLYPPVYHETNAQGLGIMYRVIDMPALLRALDGPAFGTLDATVRIALSDAFFPSAAGAHVVRFESGRVRPVPPATAPDVDVAINVADFSALVMGAVRLRSLVRYGRAVLSQPQWLSRLDAAFITDAPQCLTRF